jgi:AraC-like DNA-binding protein
VTTAVRIYRGPFGRVALLQCDKPLVTHAHPHCHVLIKISGSDTRFAVRDKDYPLADHTAILVNAWEPHGYPHLNPEARVALILALYIEPAWLTGIEHSFKSSRYPGFFARPCVPISKRLRQLADELAIAMISPYHGQLSSLESQLAELMIAVIEPFSEWRSLSALLPASPHPVGDARITRAIAYLRTNLDRQLDMAEVAAQTGLSRAHFFDLFRRRTGLSPETYANAVRMEAAIGSLASPGTSVAGLSDSLGFSAPGHFTRFFRQHLGVAPSEYRRKVEEIRPPS